MINKNNLLTSEYYWIKINFNQLAFTVIKILLINKSNLLPIILSVIKCFEQKSVIVLYINYIKNIINFTYNLYYCYLLNKFDFDDLFNEISWVYYSFESSYKYYKYSYYQDLC